MLSKIPGRLTNTNIIKAIGKDFLLVFASFFFTSDIYHKNKGKFIVT